MAMLARVLMIAVVGYLLLVLAVWAGQRFLVYAPNPTRVDPATLGEPKILERRIAAPDGVSVIAWYLAAARQQPTLLYFHGNGGNLAGRASLMRRFAAQGLGVYMMSYRGYSGSDGAPSEADNVADAQRAYADLVALGVPARDIVLYGESLGSSVATQVAIGVDAAALILAAPFTSAVDTGARTYPFLPVDLLLTHRYETIDVIAKVRTPLLVVHGEDDEVVPVGMARQLFTVAANATPKRLVTLPGAGHNDHMSYGSFEAIMAFIAEVH